jgi:hypothetical protein
MHDDLEVGIESPYMSPEGASSSRREVRFSRRSPRRCLNYTYKRYLFHARREIQVSGTTSASTTISCDRFPSFMALCLHNDLSFPSIGQHFQERRRLWR